MAMKKSELRELYLMMFPEYPDDAWYQPPSCL